jgi:hypothetical protein
MLPVEHVPRVHEDHVHVLVQDGLRAAPFTRSKKINGSLNKKIKGVSDDIIQIFEKRLLSM